MLHGTRTWTLLAQSVAKQSTSFSAPAASPSTQRNPGVRARSPKLARLMTRLVQLTPAVGYPSPRTMKRSGRLQSISFARAGVPATYLAHSTIGHDRDTMGPERSVSVWRGLSSLSGSSNLTHMASKAFRVHKGDMNLRPVLASKGCLRVLKYSDMSLNARFGAPRVTTKLHTPSAGSSSLAYS